MTHCQPSTKEADQNSSKPTSEFKFPEWLEMDAKWFEHEVGRLVLEYHPGEYRVNVVYSTYVRPYNIDGTWHTRTAHQAFAVDFHSVDCLSPGHGVIVGTVVVPAVLVGNLSRDSLSLL